MSKTTAILTLSVLAAIVVGVEAWRAMNPAIVERRVLADGTPYLDDGHSGALVIASKLAETAQNQAAAGNFADAGYLLLASGAVSATTATRNTSPTPAERAALMQFRQASLGDTFESFLAKKYPDWHVNRPRTD